MSNARAKAERSKAKDRRQIPASDKFVNGRKRGKKAKPVIVEYRCRNPIFRWGKDWMTFGRYMDRDTAIEVMENQERKDPGMYQMRIRT